MKLSLLARWVLPLNLSIVWVVSCGVFSSTDYATCEQHLTCDDGWRPSQGGASGAGGSAGTPDEPAALGGRSGAGGTDAQGGTGADGGVGGVPEPTPCNGACAAPTPVCDSSEDRCVECLENTNCSEAQPVCDVAARSCVECLESTDCKSNDAPVCNTKANECVQCAAASDCADPKASRCVEDQCTACATDADCKHIEGKGVCDAGVCVGCTVQRESVCKGNSCNPATRECTSTPVGTVKDCRPCVADSECVGGNLADPDMRCVPMEFKGTKRAGGFCLRRVAKECQRPYLISVTGQSLSGAATENYCGIDEENVRCEAVLDLTSISPTCTAGDDASCGCERDSMGKCIVPGDGGLCRDFITVKNRCTYRCGSPDHCPVGMKCDGTPIAYCQ